MASHHSDPATMNNDNSPSPLDQPMPQGKESWKHQGHAMMAMDDPENPQNWPVLKKVYASAVASAFTFVLLFAATSYSAGLPQIVMEFGVTQVRAVLGMSVFIFGIIAAPLLTPHISERVGRNTVYFTSLFIMSLFILGASRSQSFGALLACRFLAGLFGGPIAVNIEGTYADVWPATYTGTYYSFITMSQYFGAATGAVVGGALLNDIMDWRWTQYITLMLAAGALLFGIGVPESYPREIIRRRARRAGVPHNLEPALSGTTFAEMSRLTLVQPLIMLVSDPITALCALYMAMTFGITFQWFITVPPTLTMLAKFTPKQDGLAFLSAIAATVVAAVTSITLDQVLARRARGKTVDGHLPTVEHRLVSAIIGSILMATGVFWVAQTAAPAFSYYIPIIGTGVFVWGSAMSLTSIVGYLFDAFGPKAILASLSVVAYARVATAGWLPLVIIPLTNNLTPKWGLNLLGFFAAVFIFIPVALFLLGGRLRAGSSWVKKEGAMSPAMMEMNGEHNVGVDA